MTLYMKLSEDRTSVVGVPVPRPIRTDAVIDGAIYRHTDVTAYSDAELTERVGLVAVDPASDFDPSRHVADGGGDLSGDGLALPAYSVRPVTADDIAAEAERRIAVGILVDGAAFRGDDASVQRVSEMLDAFERALVPVEGVTFATAAGNVLTLTETAAAAAIYEALLRHRAAVLARSAVLRAAPPADFAEDSHWPAVQTVDLGE
ncbi:MAG: hypothetical protein RLW87_07250 [Alphaproteobacteria bacterium]